MKKYIIRINGKTAKTPYSYDQLKKIGVINNPEGVEISLENENNFVDLATYSFDEEKPFYINDKGELCSNETKGQKNSIREKNTNNVTSQKQTHYNNKKQVPDSKTTSSNNLPSIDSIVKFILTIALIVLFIYWVKEKVDKTQRQIERIERQDKVNNYLKNNKNDKKQIENFNSPYIKP